MKLTEIKPGLIEEIKFTWLAKKPISPSVAGTVTKDALASKKTLDGVTSFILNISDILIKLQLPQPFFQPS